MLAVAESVTCHAAQYPVKYEPRYQLQKSSRPAVLTAGQCLRAPALGADREGWNKKAQCSVERRTGAVGSENNPRRFGRSISRLPAGFRRLAELASQTRADRSPSAVYLAGYCPNMSSVKKKRNRILDVPELFKHQRGDTGDRDVACRIRCCRS